MALTKSRMMAERGRMRALQTLVFVVLLVQGARLWSGQTTEDFRKADQATLRLAPADFPDLPAHLVRELEKRSCTVPQELYATARQNVIRGEFRRRGQLDWAVLCSKDRVSTILVFWGGKEKAPSELAAAEDLRYLQTTGRNEISFSRVISPIGRKMILRYYDAFGGPRPPEIDHEGIQDAFVGKASVIHYFFDGNWLELTGAG
jgi:hypothetical protein